MCENFTTVIKLDFQWFHFRFQVHSAQFCIICLVYPFIVLPIWEMLNEVIGFFFFFSGGPGISFCQLHDILSFGSCHADTQLFCWCPSSILRVSVCWSKWPVLYVCRIFDDYSL